MFETNISKADSPFWVTSHLALSTRQDLRFLRLHKDHPLELFLDSEELKEFGRGLPDWMRASSIWFVPVVSRTGRDHAERLVRLLGSNLPRSTFLDQPLWTALGNKTKLQFGRKALSRRERLERAWIKEDFTLDSKLVNSLYEQNFGQEMELILVDDMLTTGSTLLECQSIVRDFGFRCDRAWTLAARP